MAEELRQRITRNTAVMGGKPCVRGMRVTVGTIVGLLAIGYDEEEIIKLYPYLDAADIKAAISHGARQTKETEGSL